MGSSGHPGGPSGYPGSRGGAGEVPSGYQGFPMVILNFWWFSRVFIGHQGFPMVEKLSRCLPRVSVGYQRLLRVPSGYFKAPPWLSGVPGVPPAM